ncbi:MAG: hypothetical protein WBE32_03455 [Pseudolabrys sp.]|jgi:hypothetical protein
MTILNRPVAFAVCALALATVAVMEPALAKDPEPYNAADARGSIAVAPTSGTAPTYRPKVCRRSTA